MPIPTALAASASVAASVATSVAASVVVSVVALFAAPLHAAERDAVESSAENTPPASRSLFASWFHGGSEDVAAATASGDAGASAARRDAVLGWFRAGRPDLSPIPDPARATELVDQALGLLGITYRLGGTSPATGFDCSGMVGYVFRNALGLTLPRRAEEISRVGQKVDREALRPGDLVFYRTLRRAVSHVGIYLGDNRFIHAPATGGSVRVDDMSESYWAHRFSGARRVD